VYEELGAATAVVDSALYEGRFTLAEAGRAGWVTGSGRVVLLA
jgi:hypothetical protein